MRAIRSSLEEMETLASESSMRSIYSSCSSADRLPQPLVRHRSQFFQPNGAPSSKLSEYDRLVPLRSRRESSQDEAVLKFSLTNARLVAANQEMLKLQAKAKTAVNSRRNSGCLLRASESGRLLEILRQERQKRFPPPKTSALEFLCKGETVRKRKKEERQSPHPEREKVAHGRQAQSQPGLDYFMKICEKLETHSRGGRNSSEKIPAIKRSAHGGGEELKKRKWAVPSVRGASWQALTKGFPFGKPKPMAKAERDFANFVRRGVVL